MILVNLLAEKIIICCFISRSFSSGIMKYCISGTICKIAIFQIAIFVGICENMKKIAIFWNSDCYICRNIELIATFFTESAAIPGKSTDLLLLV